VAPISCWTCSARDLALMGLPRAQVFCLHAGSLGCTPLWRRPWPAQSACLKPVDRFPSPDLSC